MGSREFPIFLDYITISQRESHEALDKNGADRYDGDAFRFDLALGGESWRASQPEA